MLVPASLPRAEDRTPPSDHDGSSASALLPGTRGADLNDVRGGGGTTRGFVCPAPLACASFPSYRGGVRALLRGWWRTNRTLVQWTVVVALTAGLAFGVWGGPRAGVLVAGSILALVAVLALSSATMSGMDVTLDRQIAMREREAARKAEARKDSAPRP